MRMSLLAEAPAEGESLLAEGESLLAEGESLLAEGAIRRGESGHGRRCGAGAGRGEAAA
ncbi:MAG: hypothetical protein M0Z87_00325 [Actinomycetota bacterium]|nr:hypothetical protein [Actinomycetota bacterium]